VANLASNLVDTTRTLAGRVANVKAQVAAYKYPRHVWIVDALPKGPTGKIQKRDIVIPADLAVR